MVGYYKEDLESNEERLNLWKNGKITAGERRILYTKWLGRAFDDYTKNHPDEITKAFKRCGMFNAMDGSENHLIKLRKGFDYEVPSIDAKPEPLPKKQKKGQKKG